MYRVPRYGFGVAKELEVKYTELESWLRLLLKQVELRENMVLHQREERVLSEYKQLAQNFINVHMLFIICSLCSSRILKRKVNIVDPH